MEKYFMYVKPLFNKCTTTTFPNFAFSFKIQYEV